MERRRTPSIARPVVQFGLSGLAALVVLGLAATLVLRHLGRTEAIRDARGLTLLSGRGIVEPALETGVLRGDRQAIAHLDRIVRRRILGDQVVRVKLWDSRGRIVYSDESRLIGARYSLGRDERRVLASGAVDAELSDLGRPENRFERPYGKLLEVYLPIRTHGGQRLLFEQYLRFSSVAASGRRIWTTFLPALVGALVLLWLVQLPLAWSMARRMRVAHRQREDALAKAVEASELERRRIARALHDGPVQELAGVSFSLAAAAERIRTRAPADVVEAVRNAASATRGTVRRLRSLLVEIYPPSLERAGLAAAIADAVAPAAQRGLGVRVELSDDFDASPQTQSIVFRTAQEAVRNTLAHADASRLDVNIAHRNGVAILEVIDDGCGFSPRDIPAETGHFGLTLLADLARDAGGSLTVESAVGTGTSVRLEVPA
jgi:signal transduction histidine kinase